MPTSEPTEPVAHQHEEHLVIVKGADWVAVHCCACHRSTPVDDPAVVGTIARAMNEHRAQCEAGGR